MRIRLAHERSQQTYGSPRVTKELHAQGFPCGENRVARVMRVNGIRAQGKRKYRRTTDSRHSLPVAGLMHHSDRGSRCAAYVWPLRPFAADCLSYRAIAAFSFIAYLPSHVDYANGGRGDGGNS